MSHHAERYRSLASVEYYASGLIPPEVTELERELELPERSLYIVFREKFRFKDLMGQLPVDVFTENPESGQMERRTLNAGETKRIQGQYTYQSDPDTPRRGLLWAFTEKDYQFESALRATRHEMVEERYGKTRYGIDGGFLLSNEEGGIDISQPELSAKHLLARLAIAQRYFHMEPEKMAKHNIIRPFIYNLSNENFINLYRNVAKLVAVADLSIEEGEIAIPLVQLLQQLGIQKAEKYVAEVTSSLDLLAHAAAHPSQTLKVSEVIFGKK